MSAIVDEFNKARQRTFLDALSKTGIVMKACKAARISRQTVYEHRKNDPEFAAAWNEAIDLAVEAMEAEAHRRAVQGTLKPVFYQGEKCGQIREYSDTLLIFMLKAHKPEKYRDNVKMEVTGKNGGPIETKDLALEELLKFDAGELARMYREAIGETQPS
ncbi:MAG: terminase [Armatimonadota bacterium]